MAKIIPFPERDGRSPQSAGRFPDLYGHEIGLNDDQISALISPDRRAYTSVFEVDPELTGEDRRTIPILRRAVALLNAVLEGEPLKSTAAGNLPQKLVRELFAGEFAGEESEFVRVNREDDSPNLSFVRRLCQKAGLLVYRNKEFRLAKAAGDALGAENWSLVYRKLLEAYLQKPELIEQYDLLDDGGALASALPLLLFACRDTTELLYEESFAWLIDAVGLTQGVHWLDEARIVGLRFFDRFAEPFGLLEPGPVFEPPWGGQQQYFRQFGPPRRRTELFDRVFRWHVDPPHCAFRTGRPAAAEIMYVVHDARHTQHPRFEDSWTEGMCVRAIERYPADADAYVVLANMHEHRPERALQFVEIGLEATVGEKPDVPDGISPWLDHGFRDVMRLHFVRAETLHELGRLEAACAAFERLLEIDPADDIGVRNFLVPVLVEAGSYDRACELQESVGDLPSFAAPHWNGVLIGLAMKDHASARARYAVALQINPHVPRMILRRNIPDPPPHYSPGDEDEAIIYAHSAHKAWRLVPGAIAWLREKTR